eukprot:8343430-Pyramimonas_sp.AAC.1
MSEYITIDRRGALFTPDEKPGICGRLVHAWARCVKLLAVIILLWCAYKGFEGDANYGARLNRTRTTGPWGKPWIGHGTPAIPNDVEVLPD